MFYPHLDLLLGEDGTMTFSYRRRWTPSRLARGNEGKPAKFRKFLYKRIRS